MRDNSSCQKSKHNQALHRLLNPSLRYGFVAGDGLRGAQQSLYALQPLPQRAERTRIHTHTRAWTKITSGT